MTPTQQKVLRNVINTMQKYNLHESVRKQLIKEAAEDAATIEQMNKEAANYIPGQPIPPNMIRALKRMARNIKGNIQDANGMISDALHNALNAIQDIDLDPALKKVKDGIKIGMKKYSNFLKKITGSRSFKSKPRGGGHVRGLR